MTDDPLKQFYAQTESSQHPADQPYFAFNRTYSGHDTSELVMDGRFTLEHLRRIVAAWERYNEATKEEARQ